VVDAVGRLVAGVLALQRLVKRAASVTVRVSPTESRVLSDSPARPTRPTVVLRPTAAEGGRQPD
jgi:hypothetical protein